MWGNCFVYLNLINNFDPINKNEDIKQKVNSHFKHLSKYKIIEKDTMMTKTIILT